MGLVEGGLSIYFGIPALTVAGWMTGAVAVLLVALLLFAAFNRVLLKMALRNIPRRRAQTVLILFGLMLATLIITASLSVGDTLNYSLQAIQLRQIHGIDEAFTRHQANQYVQGASTADTEFFSNAQAADVIGRSKKDPNVAAAVGLIASSGSMIDTSTGQSSSENVAIFGVPADFGTVWGALQSVSGAKLNVASLAPDEVFVGNQLGDTLNAHTGDRLELYVDGHLTLLTIRNVLDTEINPSIAGHGPIVNSVVLPLATMRTVLQRPTGYNLIFVHNRGTGGFDDLGTAGVTGDEITKHFRVEFTDPQAAAALWGYLNTKPIKAQIKKIHDQASFLDPSQDLSRRLLVELNQPAVTDEFKALAGNRFIERIMGDAVAASAAASGGADSARNAQDKLVQLVGVLQVDTPAATELKILLSRSDIQSPLTSLALALPDGDPVRTAITDLFVEVQSADLTPKFKAIIGSPDLQVQLGQAIAAIAPSQLARYNDIAGRLDLYAYSAYKADAVTFAQTGGLFITGALLGVSFFSIAVGILLIFLIFVMLAAERRAEMGMSRAVGLKRRHLTQMFLFEGTAYTLAASLVGVVLGVGVAALMIRVLSSVFSGFYKGITLSFHFEWTSLVIAVCLGVLLTFLVVAFSAYKVSRLNIVAAIRDLDESEQRDAGMLSMFTAPFKVAWLAIKQLLRGHPLVFLGRISLGTLGAIRTFWWALFRRGPLTILLGAAMVTLTLLGDSSPVSHVESVYAAGVSLVIIGAGLLLKWILTMAHVRRLAAARAGFTLAALGLLIYWGRPFGRVETVLHLESQLQTKDLVGGPEVFIISALMALLGAIWLVMYNSDLLIRGVMFFTGRISGLSAVTRTSMSYPMATKFRTGMAVAMFAIVTFIIVYMSVFKDVLVQNFAQVDSVSGGWQVVAGTPDNNFNQTEKTQFPADVSALVRSNPTAAAEVSGVGWENQSCGVQLQQVMADGTLAKVQPDSGYALHAVDDGYLATTGYSLQVRATGYTSDRAVWDAVRSNTGYAVINASSLDARNGSPADIVGIKPTDSTFKPFQVHAPTLRQGGKGGAWTLTVVGFMKSNALWGGVYVSTRTAMGSGLFAAPAGAGASPSGTQAPALGATLQPLTPTGYYFALKSGADVNKARLDLGRMLVQDQLEPVVVADQLAQQLSGTLTLLNLITGFLALGLIVGIAGLGVISTRAVVERWQQIGMLRALGYRRSVVQMSFLMESSLIAILGLIIGALVGVWQSYRFFVVDKTFGTVLFHIPVLEISLILVVAYLATLVTTFLPARAASRVAPAEALRYE
jgi:putative ABC transport system permease protein